MSVELPLRDDSPANPRRLNFLAGGGEMGARIRAFDWAATPLGPAEAWPQSLKTIVRVMLDSRYAMWMLWGPDYTFFCNDAYLPTVGLKRDWVLGARSDKVWEEIWPDVSPRIARVLEKGEATWDEGLMLFLERSGFPEETYHTFSYSPVYDDANSIAGMLCVVTEVTERVIGERRLHILRDLAARTATVDVRASCQQACAVLARYPYDIGFAGLYLVEADTGQATRAAYAGAVAELLPASLPLDGVDTPWPVAALNATETAQLLNDLPAHNIHIAAAPWPDPIQQALLLPLKGSGQQGMPGFLVVGPSPRRPFDESYRAFLGLVANQVGAALADAQAYEAERQRAAALAELDRAKTAFFSNVSHEFRTPLTLMLGPLEDMLAAADIAPRGREQLELAHRNALRLLKLVNSLLDFSRIEAGRAQAFYQPTDLASFTRDLASTFRSAIERAGLRFDVECSALGEPVYLDRDMWEKVVLNLLSNAFKFTLQGSIAVRLYRDGDRALLEVADTGIGVAAAELPRLFERFHRIEHSQGRTHEGSGIGLALVHELVKLHGGNIEAASELGEGTRFRITLPFGTAHLPAERVGPTAATAAQSSQARAFVEEATRWLPNAEIDNIAIAPLAAMPAAVDRRFADTFGARIVLADDNADMRGYVRELLASHYSVEVVADGAQALQAARRQRPDLVLSDVMMPHLDGFGLLKALRDDDALREVPIILLSARAGEDARIEGLDAGADDYLAKPFSARELLARVGALLELTQMRRENEARLRQAFETFRLRTAQFETLLNEAPVGVYLVDADFKVREMNPIARAVFGNIDPLIGCDFTTAIHRLWAADYADEIVRLFRHTLATGEAYYTPERAGERRDTGIFEYYEWQIHRIPLPDARAGVVCYFRDVGLQVEARRALLEQQRRLQEADRQKDQFLAMLAHELRNPLAPIRTASELLVQLIPSESAAQTVIGMIGRQVTQLTRLVDDLLDMSRITQSRIELKLTTVDIAQVISQAMETVEPQLREKSQHIAVISDYQHPLRVQGDFARLVQCVVNILANAAKYADAGSEIHIRSRAELGHAIIEITDRGAGIAADLLPHVFELFVQGERTLDRSQGGLGIGLSVVKRLIEMHGGSVAADSAGLGHGATFTIRLPLQDRPPHTLQHAPEITTVPKRIFVVDDNVDAANSLAALLALEGHTTRAVYDGRQALAQIAAFAPEVALLDIGLPGMNGYELAGKIRELPGMAKLRLISLTGYGQAEDRERALAAGFDDHLVKPVEFAALRKML